MQIPGRWAGPPHRPGMKRVLFVDHVSRILGGAEINLLELLTATCAGKQWLAACACPLASRLGEAVAGLQVSRWDYSLPPELNEFRLVNRRFDLRGALRSLRSLSVARKRLEAIVAAFAPDAVISCTNKDHFAAASVCRRHALPSIWWVNDIVSPEFFTWPVRTAFRHKARRGATRVVTVSDYARLALVREGMPSGTVVTIHNGIPAEKFSQSRTSLLRTQLGLEPERPVIGMVGRFTPWKGQDFFLRLAEKWLSECPQTVFVLIGQAFNEDQDYEAGLRRFVSDHHLTANVHFLPFQSNLNTLLPDLDALVHASLRPEPFGRVIIEAMAAGVPVIAARAGGVPEIITDGVNGLLAEPGDLEAYENQLRKLLRSPELATAVRQAGARTVREHFTVERVRRQFEQVVADVT